jgi:hypothetical protein
MPVLRCEHPLERTPDLKQVSRGPSQRRSDVLPKLILAKTKTAWICAAILAPAAVLAVIGQAVLGDPPDEPIVLCQVGPQGVSGGCLLIEENIDRMMRLIR